MTNPLLSQPAAQVTPKYTPEQLAFISELSSGAGSIILEAVAGSGKTTTLVAAANALPTSVSGIALAFNAKIKKELESRLPKNIKCMTLNGLGHGAWQAHTGTRLKVETNKLNKVVSETMAYHHLEKDTEGWFIVRDLVAKAKSHGMEPASYDSAIWIVEDTIPEWVSLASRYGIFLELSPKPKPTATESERAQYEENNKKRIKQYVTLAREALNLSCQQAFDSIIDFDDQLYMTYCFSAPLTQYPLVLVDEAQDLSALQHELLNGCVAPNGRLIAVGDPHQAIYGFRGADVESMSNLRDRFSMKTLPLSYSFRCGSTIIEAAQAYVPHIKAPETAPLGEIIHLDEWTAQDLANEIPCVVLCRSVAPLIRTAFRLIRAGVSCAVAGRDIGKGLVKYTKNFGSPTAYEDLLLVINEWADSEIMVAEANKDNAKAFMLNDVRETLICIAAFGTCNTVAQLTATIEELFKAETGSVILSTIHKSKGLEWDTVFLLDSYRCPASYAREPWQLVQEDNLMYIAITRAKKKLIYINSDNFINPTDDKGEQHDDE